jgi:TonB family protein
MKRRWYGRLWIWVVVSLAAHILLLRAVRLPDEHVPKNSARYEVKLLYMEPSTAKPETKIRPEKRKKKPEEKPVEKKPVKVEEEQPEEKQDEIVIAEEETGGQQEEPQPVMEQEVPAVLQEPEAKKAPDLTPVIEGLRRRIEEEMVYPYVARKKGLQGVVRLMVRLDEEGNLLEVSIAESSGYRVLDNAAAALIERIVPYPHDLGTLLSVEVPIRYSLIH